ncbi:MAG: sel1 repeat family protein, partial [Proteobacteria bacterium]|nr:sel1 repeat family protein [Pseudomonadota bacterium]
MAKGGDGGNEPMGQTVKTSTRPLFSSTRRWLRPWRLGLGRLGLAVLAMAAPGPGLAVENAVAVPTVPVPKGYIDAMSWTDRAARAGDPRAQYHLGVIHWHGLRGEKNPRLAADWFAKSAGKGYGLAQFSLGLAFELGLGRTKDAARAAPWYRLAARQGIAPAAFNLGALHERGDGVARNPAQAAVLYRQAARAGLAP